MLVERYLTPQVKKDLRRKMVFVGGPRQVGKTTLARSLLKSAAGYLNWDVPEHRERILKQELPTTRTWVFDEIHKYRLWRNFLGRRCDHISFQEQKAIDGEVEGTKDCESIALARGKRHQAKHYGNLSDAFYRLSSP